MDSVLHYSIIDDNPFRDGVESSSSCKILESIRIKLKKTITMERKEIFEKLNVIFRDVMDNDGIELDENTTAEDIEEWDSIAQMDIVLAVERHFHVKFLPEEIVALKNVGDIASLVQARRKA